MASATAGFDESIEITTQYAVEEKKKLKKSIGRLDILFFLLCTIVGFDTIGATAASGAQAFTWLIFLGIVFFLPYALLTSELGSGFPEEGGAYEWVKLAFGRRFAAVSTLSSTGHRTRSGWADRSRSSRSRRSIRSSGR